MPMVQARSIALIVGSDGLVGQALMARLQQAGERVVGTTRRRNAVDNCHLYLDLLEDVDKWRCPKPVDVAFICAGVTNHGACTREPVTTAQVNVHGVSSLVKDLVAQGAFVVYLSSNAVFDGSVARALPDDPLSPMNEQGRQKAEAERQISQLAAPVAIVRFTKIIGPATSPFCNWRVSLGKSEPIHPPADVYLAPVPLSCAVSVLRLIGDRRHSGIFQVSGGEDVSYEEVARLGARLLGAGPELVQPLEAQLSDRWLVPVPAHTTLNIDRLRSTFGIEPPDVGWTIEMAFTNPRALG